MVLSSFILDTMMSIFPSLILDTSQNEGLCALCINHEQIFIKNLSTPLQSHQMITTLHDLLHQQAMKIENICHIFVCIGPGSFTGCRSGVTIAQTFSYVLNTSISSFHSLLPFHQNNTATLFPQKAHCFLFDGNQLMTISYDKLQKTTLPLFSPIIETAKKYLPNKNIRLSHYNIQTIICQSNLSSSLEIIY